MESKDKWPYLDVDIGTVVPPQSPRVLNSVNPGMKVINDWALFYISKLTATLEGRFPSPSTRGACGSGQKGQEGGWAENFPSSKFQVLEHYHQLEAIGGRLPPSVSGKTSGVSGDEQLTYLRGSGVGLLGEKRLGIACCFFFNQ